MSKEIIKYKFYFYIYKNNGQILQFQQEKLF